MYELSEIPNKSSFKINEVCALTGIKSYVLRFWESEFTQIAPLVSSSGQKIYEHKDIETILHIKKLLFVDKLSIERAKAEIKKLMPARAFVEPAFADNEGDFDCDNGLHEVHESHETHESTDRLLLAKMQLNEILNRTKILQDKHHW